jgi:hypothetical protein
LLTLVKGGKVEADLCGLLELFEKRKVALVSVAESGYRASALVKFRSAGGVTVQHPIEESNRLWQ